MLVDVPYAVAKTFEEGDWLLLPNDALVDYAALNGRFSGHASRTEALMMLLLSRAEYDDEGRLIVRFTTNGLAEELGITSAAINSRMQNLRECGYMRCLQKGCYIPKSMERPRPSTWEILPGWCGSTLSEGTAGTVEAVDDEEL